MATLDEIVENSLYTEVKKLRDGISLVMDPKTDRIYLRKVLDVFSVPVFEYLNSHTDVHIPRIKAFWEEGDKLVVIEEYIQGTTLEELLEKGQDYKGDKFEFAEIKRILIELCDGLIFLHGANPPIIHRDVKASNVIISEDGRVKLIDYDAAKQFAKGKKKDTVLIGTQGIAAPEQYGFAQSDERTDIFALGKLMERMLSGIEHSEAGQAEKIVEKATKLQPELRYKLIQEMKTAIERLKSPMDKASPVDKRLMAAAVIIAVLLLALGFTLFKLASGNKDGGRADNNSSSDVVSSTTGDADKNVAVAQTATSDDAKEEKADDAAQTDVELRVKYLEGVNQTLPSPDDYDMLIIKIDMDNVGEYIGFGKESPETLLDSNNEDYPVLKNKLHDKGWMHANALLYRIDTTTEEQKIDPEYGDCRYTLTGDKLDEDLSHYYSYALVVNVHNGDYDVECSEEYLGKTETGRSIYNGGEFTHFIEAKGYLVFMPESLLTLDSNGHYKFNGSGIGTNLIDE